jgi:hypothetical protein
MFLYLVNCILLTGYLISLKYILIIYIYIYSQPVGLRVFTKL